jgi:hypothetical protein
MTMSIWRNYPESPVFPDVHYVLVLLRRTLLRRKPRNSLAPEYLIFMELSHTVDVFVCGGACVVVKFFLNLCLLDTLFQIMQVSKASWKSLISHLAQCCNSKDHLWQIVYWGNIQHSLNVPSECPGILCDIVHHCLSRNDVNSSDGFMHRLVG